MSMEKYGSDPKTLQRAELTMLEAKIAQFKMEKLAGADRDAAALERRRDELLASLKAMEATPA